MDQSALPAAMIGFSDFNAQPEIPVPAFSAPDGLDWQN